MFGSDEDDRSFEDMSLEEIEDEFSRKVKIGLLLAFGMGALFMWNLRNVWDNIIEMAETETDALDAVAEAHGRREHHHGFIHGVLTHQAQVDAQRARAAQGNVHAAHSTGVIRPDSE